MFGTREIYLINGNVIDVKFPTKLPVSTTPAAKSISICL
jgi:hypothetical protein